MMSSLIKIPGGSSCKISYGQYLTKSCYTVLESPSTSSATVAAGSNCNRNVSKEAITPTITEEAEKGDKTGKISFLVHYKDYNSQLQEDEQISKAIQESSIDEEMPFSMFCVGCGSKVTDGQQYMEIESTRSVWHWRSECISCHDCNEPISDLQKVSLYDNLPYHKSCYEDLHNPKCDVCKNFVPKSEDGKIKYHQNSFWHQKYCLSHATDGTPKCCSCERMEPADARYYILGDDRRLCLECLDSSIMATHECEALYIEIRNFYEGLQMKVEEQFPLLLVERRALNEALEGEKHGHKYTPEIRGLCLFEEQTVKRIVKRPNISEPYKLVRKCEVTAILILFGLPRLLTGSIIAHEMMHAWLRLQGYRNLSPEVEEGICQMLAHMWLDSELVAGSGSILSSAYSSASSSSSSLSTSSSGSSKKGQRSEFEKKLGECFKYLIETSSCTIYGDGFRKAKKAMDKYILKTILNHIHHTGTFPE